MNVCSTGYGCKSGDAALEAFGLCYNGPQPMWMAEYSGNAMVRSNGIALKDSVVSNTICNGSNMEGLSLAGRSFAVTQSLASLTHRLHAALPP
jgi:hypothetical protein